MQDEGRLSALLMASEGGTRFLAVHSSKWCGKFLLNTFTSNQMQSSSLLA